jgi:hypothetical protein
MPFDYFVATLRCPGCGEEVAAEIQTHIQGGVADGAALGVGAEIDAVFIEPDHLVRSGYALVKEPHPGDPVRLLDMWSCPSCDTEQWAAVDIVGGRIERIEGVKLDRATLESASYISDLNADVEARSLRRPDDDGLSSVDVLRRRLPS